MISSLLIANRGEIAVRIIRSCKEMGIRTVLAHSEADRLSLAAQMADEKICIGPPDSRKSYLNQSSMVSAAILTHCDAIHPGVGFLSENPSFSDLVEGSGLLFVGPSAKILSMLGDKIRAKNTARECGVPVIPGSEIDIHDIHACIREAKDMGFPIIFKAAAGGGGKGMRIVRSAEEMLESFRLAQRESEQSFEDGRIYFEKYLENPRHIEVQLIADTEGHVVHLGERDCSVQMKHQKLVEESPAPHFPEEIRQSMFADAKKLFQSIAYKGVGTVEFLFDGSQYYFIEVNARIQVEHPVTELRCGFDLIREQINVYNENILPFTQDQVRLDGYALECRINAQRPGKVTHYLPPGGYGVRVDSFLAPELTISPYYDALLAKVIVQAPDRREGILRMIRALDEYRIEGIETNLTFQKEIVSSPIFKNGVFGTSMLEEMESSK